MLKIIKVPMPDKKVYISKTNKQGINYVYYTLRAFRNAKGNPTSEAIIIGKKDLNTGMLIPNDNYFDIFDCEITVNVKGVKKWLY